MTKLSWWWVAAAIFPAAILLAGMAVAWAGLYDVAADAPHWRATSVFLERVRDRSVAARSATLIVPNLAEPALIRDGAGHYAAMCEGCHLAPGTASSELRGGLNPRPPDLTAAGRTGSPAADFWVIKHGLKMTGMPAWGVSHDDRSLWGLVAFVRQLPQLTAKEYRALKDSHTMGAIGCGQAGHEHGCAAMDHGGAGHDGHAGATSDAEPTGHDDGHQDS